MPTNDEPNIAAGGDVASQDNIGSPGGGGSPSFGKNWQGVMKSSRKVIRLSSS